MHAKKFEAEQQREVDKITSEKISWLGTPGGHYKKSVSENFDTVSFYFRRIGNLGLDQKWNWESGSWSKLRIWGKLEMAVSG